MRRGCNCLTALTKHAPTGELCVEELTGGNSPGQENMKKIREAVQDKGMRSLVETVLSQVVRPLASRELTMRDVGWMGSWSKLSRSSVEEHE
jgi:hypothetical protein